jgi:tetratricopeptide (TPR) repeat protein
MAGPYQDERDTPSDSDIADARPDSDGLEHRRVFAAVKQRLFAASEHHALRVGRFSVLERIGSGGMAVVYAAYDPELDRKVALKLVPLGSVSDDPEAAREALVAEARTAAQLDHPNVVSVFDAGVHEDHVYIAMEFVAGESLAEWLGGDPAWDDVVDVFVQVGRGLAAAHAAGIVHRDVKPSNIMLGRDATGELRARLVDFGIARPADDAGGSAGTPGYMAPEQYRGEATGPRTDQFGYCASLWEALYGERPFGREASVDALLDTIERGPDPTSSSPRKGVPEWVREVVAGGLRSDPNRRHASMGAIVELLSRDRDAGRRRAVVGVAFGAIAVALAVTAFAVSRDGRSGPVCSADDPELAAAWNDELRSAASSAFGGAGLSYGPATWAYIERQLDAYRDDWTATQQHACEATHVHGTQSEDLLDRRMSCLHQRRAELSAVVDVLVGADEKIVAAGLRTLRALHPVDMCNDADALSALVPPPEGDEARAIWRRVVRELAAAAAAVAAGRYAPARATLDALRPDVEGLGYAPAEAQLLSALGSVHDRMGEHELAVSMLRRALIAAERGHADHVAALISVRLAFIAGYRKHDIVVGTQWLDIADAKLARSNTRHSAAGGESHNVRAMMAYRDGRLLESIEHYRNALTLRSELFGANSVEVAATLNNMANSYNDIGDVDRAIEYYRRALAVRRAALGDRHPYVATTLTNLGTALKLREGWKAAVEVYEEALSIRVEAFGEIHVDTAWTVNNLANAYKEGEQIDRARQLHERALTIRKSLFGERHRDVAVSLLNIGTLIREQGDCASALPYFEQSSTMWAENVRADHPHLAYPLSEQGVCTHLLGRVEEGVALLERALTLREVGDDADYLVGIVRFWLARARWDANVDRPAQIESAKRARTELTNERPTQAAEVDAWLATVR